MGLCESTHSETYNIGTKNYTATVNLAENRLWITSGGELIHLVSLSAYRDFNGNMESYVNYVVNNL